MEAHSDATYSSEFMDQVIQEVANSTVGSKQDEESLASYSQLLSELEQCEDMATMQHFFENISNNAGIIAKQFKKFDRLLSMMFLFDFRCDDLQVCQTYTKFLVNLCSANAGFLKASFDLLINSLKPKASDDKGDTTDVEDGKKDSMDLLAKENDYKWYVLLEKPQRKLVHKTLEKILKLLPLGCNTLLECIEESFPKRNSSLIIQREFLSELLTVIEYVPVLRQNVFKLIINRILDMDIEARPDALASIEKLKTTTILKENDSNNNKKRKLSMDEIPSPERKKQKFNTTTTTTSTTTSTETTTITTTSSSNLIATPTTMLLAEKTDTLLIILMKFMDKCYDQNTDYKGTKNSLYNDFVQLFDTSILNQKGTNSLQYLMFYLITKRKPLFYKIFIKHLLKNATSQKMKLHKDLRTRSSGYLGGILARANFITPNVIINSIKKLFKWIKKYNDLVVKNYNSSSIIDLKDHLLFYANCQAFIYALLFKQQSIVHEKNLLKSLEFEILLNSPLQPLNVIEKHIIEEFINFANVHLVSIVNRISPKIKGDETTIESIIRNNSNIKHANEKIKDKKFVEKNLAQLFPFDPCLLKRVNAKVAPFYQEWFDTFDDVDQDDEEEEEQEDNEDILMVEEIVDDNEISDNSSTLLEEDENSNDELNDKAVLEKSSELPLAIDIRQFTKNEVITSHFFNTSNKPSIIPTSTKLYNIAPTRTSSRNRAVSYASSMGNSIISAVENVQEDSLTTKHKNETNNVEMSDDEDDLESIGSW